MLLSVFIKRVFLKWMDCNQQHLSYNVVTRTIVQMLNRNDNHWVTVSNINGSNEITVYMYDSINFGYVSKEVKQQIAAMIFSSKKRLCTVIQCEVCGERFHTRQYLGRLREKMAVSTVSKC